MSQCLTVVHSHSPVKSHVCDNETLKSTGPSQHAANLPRLCGSYDLNLLNLKDVKMKNVTTKREESRWAHDTHALILLIFSYCVCLRPPVVQVTVSSYCVMLTGVRSLTWSSVKEMRNL